MLKKRIIESKECKRHLINLVACSGLAPAIPCLSYVGTIGDAGGVSSEQSRITSLDHFPGAHMAFDTTQDTILGQSTFMTFTNSQLILIANSGMDSYS